jgi:hypothetical protein
MRPGGAAESSACNSVETLLRLIWRLWHLAALEASGRPLAIQPDRLPPVAARMRPGGAAERSACNSVGTPAAIDLAVVDIWLRWRLQAGRSPFSLTDSLTVAARR